MLSCGVSQRNSDRTIYEDEEEEDMTFKVKYNMTKNAKQNLIKHKYGQTQRVNTCFEKLETFIDLYFTDADISQDEGGKFIYKFMDEE